jgi:signal transduction histidine kinase
LSAKILAGTSIAVIVTTLLSGFYLSHVQHESLEAAFDKQSQTIASTIAVFSIEPLLTMDYPVLEHALKVAGQADDMILYIEIMHRGAVVAAYGKETREGRAFTGEIRIREGDAGKLGDVYVVFSTAEHDAFMRDSLGKIALATLVIFCAFGVALIGLLRRIVIFPIENLTQQTESTIALALPELAAEQDSSSSSQDEIQTLKARFVALLGGLQRRESAREMAEAALLEHKNDLERQVEQRTRALREAQQEAIRLNNAKSEFLAAASHDLRQPIQAISLFQSALAASDLNEEQAGLNRSIGVAASSLTEILSTLLDISRLNSGGVKPVVQAFSSEELFARIDDTFGQVAKQKGLRFKLWFPMAGLTFETDPNLLFTLIRNLIDNAIKYTPAGGILISARRRGDHALLQVWDTGIGIATESQAVIFDEYTQVGNPERDKAKGLGLGLSIVKRIATLLGTTVQVRSALGRGAVFELIIPLYRPPVADASFERVEARGRAARAFNFKNRKVVVVEDDALVSVALTVSLEAQGMTVVHYDNGADALAGDAIVDADFLISDYWLPGELNGVQLVPKLLARAEKSPRTVLITGDATAELPESLRDAGYALLYKPIRLAQLLSVLAGHEGVVRGR